MQGFERLKHKPATTTTVAARRRDQVRRMGRNEGHGKGKRTKIYSKVYKLYKAGERERECVAATAAAAAV